jgi:hypothetical protein
MHVTQLARTPLLYLCFSINLTTFKASATLKYYLGVGNFKSTLYRDKIRTTWLPFNYLKKKAERSTSSFSASRLSNLAIFAIGISGSVVCLWASTAEPAPSLPTHGVNCKYSS